MQSTSIKHKKTSLKTPPYKKYAKKNGQKTPHSYTSHTPTSAKQNIYITNNRNVTIKSKHQHLYNTYHTEHNKKALGVINTKATDCITQNNLYKYKSKATKN